MLVVADASPLVILVNIGHIDVLPVLFGEIVIPPEISNELRSPIRPQLVRDFVRSNPTWLVERIPTTIEALPRLDPGERAAISLATEIHANLILIDEIRGRREVQRRGMRFTGTLGVLEMAADAGLLDLAAAFDQIRLTNFWVTNKLLDQILKSYRAKKGGPT